jgi:hypothetical protein
MARAVEFLGRPASVRAARVFTGNVLADAGVEGSVIELAELLVSELAAYAAVHARGMVRLTVHADAHWVRIEVEDEGRGRPVLRPATRDQVDGTRFGDRGRSRDRLGNRTACNPQSCLVRDRSLAVSRRDDERHIPANHTAHEDRHEHDPPDHAVAGVAEGRAHRDAESYDARDQSDERANADSTMSSLRMALPEVRAESAHPTHRHRSDRCGLGR